jgi:hypothetical protein
VDNTRDNNPTLVASCTPDVCNHRTALRDLRKPTLAVVAKREADATGKVSNSANPVRPSPCSPCSPAPVVFPGHAITLPAIPPRYETRTLFDKLCCTRVGDATPANNGPLMRLPQIFGQSLLASPLARHRLSVAWPFFVFGAHLKRRGATCQSFPLSLPLPKHPSINYQLLNGVSVPV